jgi:hypothetical protein
LASTLQLTLGGLDLRVAAEEALLPPEGDAYRAFVAEVAAGEAPPPGAARVSIHVTDAPRTAGRVLFESDAAWTILQDDTRRTLVDWDAAGPVLSVHFEPGSFDVRAECSPRWRAAGPTSALRCPIRYPVDQVLAMYLLGREGLIVHAAGAIVRGRAVVLPGVSGAGKTTFTALARGRAGWEPLSDDRVIVRVPDGASGATAHGTPWPGEGRVAENRSAPLERLVFLAQGDVNAVTPLSPGAAARRLLPAASVPWFDADHLGAALDACDRLVGRVPASLLTFRPNGGAVDLVESLLRGEHGAGA